jgi:hypothetical protein
MYACTSVRWGWIGCADALAGSCCGLGLNPKALSHASPCPSASTACGVGAQAFYSASAFNANIGAWNTARVTTLPTVCAAPGPAARTTADALGGASNVARPVVRGGTADARARCAHVQALACAGAPSTSLPNLYIAMCVNF